MREDDEDDEEGRRRRGRGEMPRSLLSSGGSLKYKEAKMDIISFMFMREREKEERERKIKEMMRNVCGRSDIS